MYKVIYETYCDRPGSHCRPTEHTARFAIIATISAITFYYSHYWQSCLLLILKAVS